MFLAAVYFGRAEILSVCPDFATCFKRTTQGVQRCKNEQERIGLTPQVQTLCVPCHKAKTKAEAQQAAAARRAAKEAAQDAAREAVRARRAAPPPPPPPPSPVFAFTSTPAPRTPVAKKPTPLSCAPRTNADTAAFLARLAADEAAGDDDESWM